MIGIIVLLLFSWLLVHFFEKKNLFALWLLPINKKAVQFSKGFIISALLCVLVMLLEVYLKSSEWILNENMRVGIVLKSFWWDIKSVLTEELVFRGVILYFLIKKIGSWKSILISAISFGIYHWFSYGVLGNVMAMILVFVGTGLMGYAWGWAFSKTKSILLPFGLHLGWNFVYNTIFSQGPLGDMLLIQTGGVEPGEWASLLNFTSGLVLVPVIVLLFVKYLVKGES
ncbi:MAG: hypothetical protein SCALA702_04750 [Melioribacteraceae bacterium]|nr:MAG: hypothetical protein SCALA702_04750 [Melioribacteraceae bacterium]